MHSFSLKMGQALTILQVLTFAVRKGREISDQLNRAAENRVKLKKCSLHRRIHYNCYLPLGTATDSSELPMQYHSSHKYISFSVKPDSYWLQFMQGMRCIRTLYSVAFLICTNITININHITKVTIKWTYTLMHSCRHNCIPVKCMSARICVRSTFSLKLAAESYSSSSTLLPLTSRAHVLQHAAYNYCVRNFFFLRAVRQADSTYQPATCMHGHAHALPHAAHYCA